MLGSMCLNRDAESAPFPPEGCAFIFRHLLFHHVLSSGTHQQPSGGVASNHFAQRLSGTPAPDWTESWTKGGRLPNARRLQEACIYWRYLARPPGLEPGTLCLEGFQSPAKSAIC